MPALYQPLYSHFKTTSSIIYYAKTLILVLLLGFSYTNSNATIRYVKVTAAGLGTGSSWANASDDLQSMINASSSGDEVWVAAGVYLPTVDPSGNSNPSDARDKTFRLKSGVDMYGGFAGTETAISQRNLAVNITILSGDIGVANTATDNCYHVVMSVISLSATGYIFDGFRITKGYATGNSTTAVGSFNMDQGYGGAMFISGGLTTTLRNVHITGNVSSNYGGGIYSENTRLNLLIDSIYSNNGPWGAGIHINGSDSLVIDSSAIYLNTSNGGGGGMYVGVNTGTISNSSIFRNTSTGYGGGIEMSAGTMTLINNAIYTNKCGYYGGGAFLDGGNFTHYTLINNAIFQDTADKGGGIYVNDGSATVTGNTFFNNVTYSGGGGIVFLSDSANFKNNIFWKNKKLGSLNSWSEDDFSVAYFHTSTFNNNFLQHPATSYLVQNGRGNNAIGAGASGNIFAYDPAFVNESDPLGADGIARTSDDGVALSSCSIAVNAGITPSPAVPTDILGNSRVSTYDMGAYEFQGTPLNPTAVGPITGSSLLCTNTTIQLSNTVSGGVWSSSDTAIARVSSTGVVTGATAGTVNIIYTHGNTGCVNTSTFKAITVINPPTVTPITGADSVCAGSTLWLNTTTNGGYGYYYSGNTALATVTTSLYSGYVTALSPGNLVITYTLVHGCSVSVTKNIKVNPRPVVSAITGGNVVCTGSTLQLTDTTSGGVWNASNNRVTVSSTGLVTGIATGSSTVTYTVTNSLGCSTTVSQIITVNASPSVSAISGIDSLCANQATLYTDTTTSGTWGSLNTNIATVGTGGVVTGVSNGTASITYTITGSNGCTAIASKDIYIEAITPINAITGASMVCLNTTAQYNNTTTGGVWSTKSNGAVAGISSTGLLTAYNTGQDTVLYTVRNPSGCDNEVQFVINVNAPVITSITGADSICNGTTTQLSHSISGGSWTNFSTSFGSISTSGLYSPVATGIDTVYYQYLSNGCPAETKKSLVVKAPLHIALTGVDTLCSAATTLFSHSIPGGTWSNFNTSFGTVNSTGSYTSATAGIDTIYYQYTSIGCPAHAKKPLVVKEPRLSPVTGADSICFGTGTQLADTISGGRWSNLNITIGSVSSTGLYTSAGKGVDTVYYQYTSNGCPATASKAVVVQMQDSAAITGGSTVCKGELLQLMPSIAGGAWTGNNNAIAIVNSAGQVSGVSAGTAIFTYKLTNTLGCTGVTTHTVTVNEAITTTSQNSTTLKATGSQSGAIYQWINCSDNQPIPGATNSTYIANANGQYAVIVTYLGCADTSACLTVTGVGIETIKDFSQILIIPNPATEFVKIQTGGRLATSIKLYDVVGRFIKEIIPQASESVINISDLPKDIYQLHINFSGEIVVRKLVVR